jgi:tight adherence protein B
MVLVVTMIFEVVRVVLYLDLWLCAIISLVLGAMLPLWFIGHLRRRRYGKIASQLPDALDMLCRSMRAGHPVASGIKMVSEEMPDPIGTEFGLVYDEMSYGMDLRQSLEKMSRRLRIFEINYMITSMRLQAGTGGNLAEILGSLANVIRERKKLHDKVRALSAEARLSGKILGALPFGVVTILVIINPHYYDGARTNLLLMSILVGAVALCFVGIFLLRRVVNAIRV